MRCLLFLLISYNLTQAFGGLPVITLIHYVVYSCLATHWDVTMCIMKYLSDTF